MITILKKKLNQFPRHWVVTASAWTSRVITSFISIISIRELLLYLGEERYAVYVIAYSLIGWFNLAQFGLGLSLQNFISECRAKNENYDKYMISALQIILVLLLFCFIATLVIAAPLQNILLRKFPIINEPIVLTIGIITLVTIFSSISYNVYFAKHKGYAPNILPAIASVISMSGIVIVNRYSHMDANITTAIIIFTAPQMILAAILFCKAFNPFFSKILKTDFSSLKKLFIRAAKFHATALLGAVYILTDYIIASQILPPDEIIKYNIHMKLFMIPLFLYSSLLAAVWPVRSEMYVKQNFEELKGMLKRYSFYGVILILLFSLPVIIFKDLIIRVLLPNANIHSGISIIILFIIYGIIRTIIDNYSTFLGSINALRIYLIYSPVLITANIFLQLYFAGKYGAEGIVTGLILSICLTALWILPLKTYKVLKT